MASPPRHDRALLAAFMLSGVAALGYELIWTRVLALALGNEVLGVLGALAGFFGGMALGSLVMHDRVQRSENPGQLFARLEIVAAAFAAISPWLLLQLADFLPRIVGPLAGDNDTSTGLAVSVLVAGVVLLPGSFCLGATLPALVETRRRAMPSEPDGRGLGRLYAANTLGATLGVVVTVHVLIPALGLGIGALVLAMFGVCAAGLALSWCSGVDLRRRAERATDAAPPIDTSRDPDPDVHREPRLLLWMMLGTGLVGVGLEVVGVRVLAQVLENTMYTFADVLAVYLLGTAIGAALYARYAKRAITGRPAIVIAAMLIALALAVIGAAIALALARPLLDWLADDSAGYAQHLMAEALVAACVFGPSTLLMGALFSHLAGLLAPSGIGRAYALNTLGSALAPFVFGVWAITALGYTDALYAVVYGYVLLFGLFTWMRRFKPVWQIGAILGVVAASALGPKSLVLVTPDDDWKVLESRETLLGLVIVSEREGDGTRAPLRRLQVGRHFRMGGAMAFGERRMGHLPLLLHPAPADVLVLGVGTGATAGAVADFDLHHVDAVELVPGVVEQLHYFEDINRGLMTNPKVTLHAADARRFVAASSDSYDVVIADLFHPGRDGAGSLYAREHFANVRTHLRPGGLFAQWLPMYQLDAATLRLIIRTFVGEFPEAYAWLGIYNVQTPAIALIGRVPTPDADDLEISLPQLRAQLGKPVYADLLMSDPRDLLGSYLLDRDGLVAFAGDGPINSDIHPRVATGAPRSAYVQDPDRGRNNLAELLASRVRLPADMVTGADPADRVAEEAESFAHALESYLRAEGARAQTNSATTPMTAVEGYLQAYEAAPEFTAARGMLYLLARQSGEYAEAIYPRMLARTPEQPRVYQEYLGYLQRIGDQRRFDRVMAQAREFLPTPAPTEAPVPPTAPAPAPSGPVPAPEP
jgi:spermidine synthase